MKKQVFLSMGAMLLLFPLCAFDGCDNYKSGVPVSASGVHKADVTVPVGNDGLTTEQRNIHDRLQNDNKPGAIKHLYVISPYSGQVILYSTVRGKVTSGGKRLTPTTVLAQDPYQAPTRGMTVDIGGHNYITSEVLQDDGTYGNSGEYLYWWDVRGSYRQLYLTGGEIVMISDQPLPIKSVTLNFESADQK
jgi:hypothetical protein